MATNEHSRLSRRQECHKVSFQSFADIFQEPKVPIEQKVTPRLTHLVISHPVPLHISILDFHGHLCQPSIIDPSGLCNIGLYRLNAA